MRGDRILRKLGWLVVPALLCLHAGVAEAYVGPGAGFAAGSIAGVFLAFFAALLSIVTWPIRFGFRSFRRRLSGAPQGNPPSRFLMDIPHDLMAAPALRRRGSAARAAGLNVVQQTTMAMGGTATDAQQPAGPAPFKAGDKVVHATFGKGIVVNCTPKPSDFELTVAFVGDSGVKRLLHSFAKLERAEQTSTP